MINVKKPLLFNYLTAQLQSLLQQSCRILPVLTVITARSFFLLLPGGTCSPSSRRLSALLWKAFQLGFVGPGQWLSAGRVLQQWRFRPLSFDSQVSVLHKDAVIAFSADRFCKELELFLIRDSKCTLQYQNVCLLTKLFVNESVIGTIEIAEIKVNRC